MDRWPVKVGVDLDKEKVDTAKPKDATIAELLSLRIHEIPYPYKNRIPPEELIVYRVRATLVLIRNEQDSDIHLVLADMNDPKLTMIAELPAPECAEGSRFATEIAATRRIVAELKQGQIVDVTGVGFWDFIHQQRGAAKNGFELHPALSVRVVHQELDH